MDYLAIQINNLAQEIEPFDQNYYFHDSDKETVQETSKVPKQEVVKGMVVDDDSDEEANEEDLGAERIVYTQEERNPEDD